MDTIQAPTQAQGEVTPQWHYITAPTGPLDVIEPIGTFLTFHVALSQEDMAVVRSTMLLPAPFAGRLLKGGQARHLARRVKR